MLRKLSMTPSQKDDGHKFSHYRRRS